VLGSPDYRQVIYLRRLWVRVRAAFGDGYCICVSAGGRGARLRNTIEYIGLLV
jgi:hypothetical protein